MTQYILTYFGEPKLETPEAGKQYQARWMAWQNGLGDSFVGLSPMGPAKKVVSSDAVNDYDANGDHLSGYAVIQAESLDDAIEKVKGCPHLDYGNIMVAEQFQM